MTHSNLESTLISKNYVSVLLQQKLPCSVQKIRIKNGPTDLTKTLTSYSRVFPALNVSMFYLEVEGLNPFFKLLEMEIA